MEKQAFRFSGEDARNYEQYLGPLLFEPYAVEVASHVPTTPQSVLELACGTGRVTRHLRKRLPLSARLIATDLSPDMLEVARERLQDPSIDFRMADAMDLPFPANSFDVVVCQFGLMFLPDKQKGVNEAYRVLKPGGTFIFNTWDKTATMPLLSLVFDDTILPFFSGEEIDPFVLPFSLHDPIQLQAFMEKASFRNSSVIRVTLQGKSSSPQEVVNGFLLKHPMGKEVSGRDPGALEPMAKKLEAEIETRFGTPVETELNAFLVSGTK